MLLKSPSRRTFLKSTATATAGAVLTAPMFLRARGANEKLNIAMIGSGGRGGANLRGVEGENIVALCDVDKNAVETAAKKHSTCHKGRIPVLVMPDAASAHGYVQYNAGNAVRWYRRLRPCSPCR